MPVKFLQNINKQSIEYLYDVEQAQGQSYLVLLPKVMYCLRQFSEIIEELCQKRWVDYIRLNQKNLAVLNQLPDLNTFLFASQRNQLKHVAEVLIELQQCQCFYCGKSLKNKKTAVDHFIPWSLYSADTGHNFVLADSSCNAQKTNYLASTRFLAKWMQRNQQHNAVIHAELSQLGFLTDVKRSSHIAAWAYQHAFDNQYLVWDGGKTTGFLDESDTREIVLMLNYEHTFGRLSI